MILREVLHAHLPILRQTDSVRDAIDKMDIYQFPALVVIDEDRKPIGVVTEGDLVRASQSRDSVISLANDPAYIYGAKEPITASPDTDIGDAFHRMQMSGLTLLPVVEDSKLLGVVMRMDLMQALYLDAARPKAGDLD